MQHPSAMAMYGDTRRSIAGIGHRRNLRYNKRAGTALPTLPGSHQNVGKHVMTEDNHITEEWRPVVGGEGKYEVSSHGRVRSLPGDGRHNKVLSPSLSAGYPAVRMKQFGGLQKVHWLVCRAFHGDKPTPGHQVLHWDGNKLNSHYTNLRWGTRSENVLDAQRHGTMPTKKLPPGHARGEGHYNSVLTNEKVKRIRFFYKNGYTIKHIAEIMGVSRTVVSCVARKITWKHVRDSHGEE